MTYFIADTHLCVSCDVVDYTPVIIGKLDKALNI